jgi:hypothetical protein
MKKVFFVLLGWLGAGAVLSAFGLLNFGIIASQSQLYHFLNMFGALGVVSEAVYKKDWPPAFLNIVWFLVALVSLVMAK